MSGPERRRQRKRRQCQRQQAARQQRVHPRCCRKSMPIPPPLCSPPPLSATESGWYPSASVGLARATGGLLSLARAARRAAARRQRARGGPPRRPRILLSRAVNLAIAQVGTATCIDRSCIAAATARAWPRPPPSPPCVGVVGTSLRSWSRAAGLTHSALSQIPVPVSSRRKPRPPRRCKVRPLAS
eukprot:COSAG05_NODE_2462_length_3031_cov_10.605048_3_plen_186_part_00